MRTQKTFKVLSYGKKQKNKTKQNKTTISKSRALKNEKLIIELAWNISSPNFRMEVSSLSKCFFLLAFFNALSLKINFIKKKVYFGTGIVLIHNILIL